MELRDAGWTGLTLASAKKDPQVGRKAAAAGRAATSFVVLNP